MSAKNNRSAAKERWMFETPQRILDALHGVCVELDREYPYLAHFHLEVDGEYKLFSLQTVSRTISRHDDKEHLGNTGWDVDWITRDLRYAYHQSSYGGNFRHDVSGVYWRHPALIHAVREKTSRYCNKDFRKRNRTRRLRRIPPEMLKSPYLEGQLYEDLMGMLEDTGVESSVYYCSICKEYLPDRDEDLCAHVWPCDTDLTLRGPGATEEYGTEPCTDEECYFCSRARERAS